MTLGNKSSQAVEFWRVLSSYEDATIQEALALSAHDFARLDALGEFKRGALSQMQSLGVKFGLDRRNNDLRERLEALEAAETMNAESAAVMMLQVKREANDVVSASRRLISLRGAYAGDSPESAFFAEG